MKRVSIIVLLIVACVALYAQNTPKQQLIFIGKQTPTATQGSVTIHKSESAREALAKIKTQPSSQKFNGYRIGIFFDNSQGARTKAITADSLFKENFKGINSYMKYESPYYKVTVGDCLNEEEAVILFERVKTVFPNAYLLREQMELKDLIVTPVEQPIEEVDSLSELLRIEKN